tara:strand:- start:13800 stop:14516 length:717 start_codon:yes stop_codon:yes gene_type:complete
MSGSRKYGRTYHYDFSPGTTSDDRINRDWYDHIKRMEKTIDTEKMDGENRCLNGMGMFARSHAAPTTNPWATHLKPKYDMIKNDLKEGDIEIFGEDIYAVHSITYPNIKEHFYVFGVRILDKWMSWEEVEWYASIFDFPTVPITSMDVVEKLSKREIENRIKHESELPSTFGSYQVVGRDEWGEECTKEGIVTRNYDEFDVQLQHENIFKYVRKGHVKTDEHWTRNWKRAPLLWEKKK